MCDLQALPNELFDIIIEHLVVKIGIYKAVLLRTVNRAFNAAILEAICVKQVVDIDDPATSCLPRRIDPTLRAKIFEVGSRSANVASSTYLSVVSTVNRTLDTMIAYQDQELVQRRHEAIAGAVFFIRDPVHPKIDMLSILSGAAIIGNLSLVKTLLKSDDIDVNGRARYFESPLTLAAGRGHLSIVQYLLDCGARLDSVARDWHKIRRLTCQADWEKADDVERWHSLTDSFPSALRSAVLGGHDDIVDLLLHQQHRLSITSLEYLRAIMAGAKAGRLDLMWKLFEVIGKDLLEFTGLGNEMLWEATRYGQEKVVQWFLDKGVNVNVFPDYDRGSLYSALQIAASLGNISMARLLLDRGADVNLNGHNRPGQSPIEGAAQCGQEEMVKLLIDHGADPGKALQGAAAGGQPRLMKILLNRLPDLPNRNGGDVGRMALFRACACRNLTAITMLVEAGVSINQGSPDPSVPPLNYAKQDGVQWMADHLISLGALETDWAMRSDEQGCEAREIRVSERTWEWVGKY